MFGCVVAGRLLQTNLQQIDETHALFEIADAGSINHISVFLLGTGRCHFHFFKLYRWNIQFCSTVPRRIWCYRSFPLARKRIPIIRDVSTPFPVRPPSSHSPQAIERKTVRNISSPRNLHAKHHSYPIRLHQLQLFSTECCECYSHLRLLHWTTPSDPRTSFFIAVF